MRSVANIRTCCVRVNGSSLCRCLLFFREKSRSPSRSFSPSLFTRKQARNLGRVTPVSSTSPHPAASANATPLRRRRPSRQGGDVAGRRGGRATPRRPRRGMGRPPRRRPGGGHTPPCRAAARQPRPRRRARRDGGWEEDLERAARRAGRRRAPAGRRRAQPPRRAPLHRDPRGGEAPLELSNFQIHFFISALWIM
jgi:hypothetical protein